MKRAVAIILGSLIAPLVFAGPLKFSVGQKWAFKETMTMSGKVTRSRLEYVVDRIYPDGTALVTWKLAKIDPPIASPMLGKVFHWLVDSEGRIYQVDDPAPLKAAKSSAEWRKDKSEVDQWVSGVRGADQTVGGKKCAVFASQEGPISKIVWVDMAQGQLIKRKTTQGKEFSVVDEQVP